MKPDSRKCTWSMLSERTEMQPDIQFTPTALKWIKAMVEEHSGEVGFMGLVNESEGSFIVSEIFYPKHCLVTSTTCEIAPEGMTELAQKMIDEDRMDDIGKIRFWGHSHHTMGTTPSGQDDTQALEMMNSSGAYLIRAICTKNGEMSVSYFDRERQLKFENVKWTILQNYDDMVNDVISVVNTESNSKEKVQAIRKAVSTKVVFDDDEYKEIAEKVKELKKIQLPPETRGSVQQPYKGRGMHSNYGHQRRDFLPGFQRDMFEDDDWMQGSPYGGYRPPYNSNNQRRHQKVNGQKKTEKNMGPLLTLQEIESVVDAAWEGETP